MKIVTQFSIAAALCALVCASPAIADGYLRTEAIIPMAAPNAVVNGIGLPPTSPEDLLWNKQPCEPGGALQPILAPDGHHVTWGEYSQMSGRAALRCGPKGTHVVIQLSGLIPKGVYTLWVFVFDENGKRLGAGALGAPDGSESGFIASASGRGTLAAHHPEGTLSAIPYDVGCLLDEVVVHLVVAYHLDGLVYGPFPAPIRGPFGACYWVPHAAFLIE